MSKSAEYRLTPEAARDMETIWLYTLKEWGLEQANRYTDELTEAFGQLLITK
ncbi:MAG TPA: type II toxin-antitoxin system RelE/ParE family toxin [Nitrosomonas sp.]|nr:type II toxin-antitoxin system RelE/ParE family toxin [Candidatus Brachybacter algidus]MBP6355349.1 type II toxin-antitoxin system RelE/ParE family toxin [Nitrosomonas sp.]MBP9871660.1 type II toxin-antitoxin system RelE/ParE family toxin [Nitrosomonas sp.]HRB98138.1 type II toxin-antitoxin system RelE/ParE family toxin [Nitrosomonas sp.]